MKWKMDIKPSFYQKINTARATMAMRKALTETCIELRNTLAQPPTPKRTGNLRRSNTYDVTTNGNTLIGRVKNSAPYWIYVDQKPNKKGSDHFVEKALKKVKPREKTAETFKKIFKEKV